MNSVGERIGSKDELFRRIKASWSANLRVAAPGIINSFDPVTQTATVQIALKDIVTIDSDVKELPIPLLVDVPVMFPRGGGFAVTFPVAKGDECLVIFSDMCIDAWFSNSGVQSQIENRRHDLSDGIAILGLYSQPKKISAFSQTSMQIRSLTGNAKITIKSNEIDFDAMEVKVNGISIIPT